MGGTDFKWGTGHHWPPAGDGPGFGVVFTSGGRRKKEIDTRARKANAEFHRSEVTKRELANTAKLSLFKSVCFQPSLVTNLGLDNHWKSVISSTRLKDRISAKSSRCDTSRQSALLWNSQILVCRATSLKQRNLRYVGSATWPECTRKDWRGKCWACYNHRKEAQRSTKDQVAR